MVASVKDVLRIIQMDKVELIKLFNNRVGDQSLEGPIILEPTDGEVEIMRARLIENINNEEKKSALDKTEEKELKPDKKPEIRKKHELSVDPQNKFWMFHHHSYKELIKNNEAFAKKTMRDDPGYFKHLAAKQQPPFLYIGCSDSRVPISAYTGANPGEIFIQRNVANQIKVDDPNIMSVLEFSVDVLNVQHIIVCGHRNCGGVAAAYNSATSEKPPSDLCHVQSWISPLKWLAKKSLPELEKLPTTTDKLNRLSELNVEAQIENLLKTDVIQRALSSNKCPIIHGWVINLEEGRIIDLELPWERWEKDYGLPNKRFLPERSEINEMFQIEKDTDILINEVAKSYDEIFQMQQIQFQQLLAKFVKETKKTKPPAPVKQTIRRDPKPEEKKDTRTAFLKRRSHKSQEEEVKKSEKPKQSSKLQKFQTSCIQLYEKIMSEGTKFAERNDAAVNDYKVELGQNFNTLASTQKNCATKIANILNIVKHAKAATQEEYHYCISEICTRTLAVCRSRIGLHPPTGWVFASLILAISQEFQYVLYAVLGSLYTECIFTIPEFPSDTGKSRDDYLVACGFERDERGRVESEKSFTQRVKGIFVLYCCVIVGLTYIPKEPTIYLMWNWLATVILQDPSHEFVSIFSSWFIPLCTNRFLTTYGYEIVSTFSKDVLGNMLPNSPIQKHAKQKLKLFFKKEQFYSLPEGMRLDFEQQD